MALPGPRHMGRIQQHSAIIFLSLFLVLHTHYPHPRFHYDVSIPLYCLHELYSLLITLFATRSQVPPSFSQIVFLLLSCPICFWISSPHINTHSLSYWFYLILLSRITTSSICFPAFGIISFFTAAYNSTLHILLSIHPLRMLMDI